VQQQPITPLIVELTQSAATEEITVGDVLARAMGFTGGMILVGVALALLFAGALIGLRRLSPSNSLNGAETERTRMGLHLPSR